MNRYTTRVAPLLVGMLTFAATALPAAADPDEDGGWGQQAVDWCREGNAEQFKNFGQCVSQHVHDLKGESKDVEDERDIEDEQDDAAGHGHGPKTQLSQQGGQGRGHQFGKDQDDTDDVEDQEDAGHGHGPKHQTGQQGGQGHGQGQGVGKNKHQ
jgi:hypothetical protein